ncbi:MULTISPECIES: MFS transporter [unclassified Microbacterium]|uniref:MFS transporter n=1 Tax=unclassified Microbacterium TaxID=2609290 RepID=UPI0012FBA6BA|nr:MFS transporter [Microbacterium sp. MAH-37]MVQ42854.1 MFS transporter [Microbacterium sp. MAH-37]
MPTRSSLPAAFTRLSSASALTLSAEQLALAAAPLAAVMILGAGATETALLQVAQTLPFLLLAIPFGLLVDRFSPRRFLLGAEMLRVLTLLCVVVLLLVDALTFPALLALGLIGAIGTVAFSVAVPATVPAVVDRERLVDANRWIELGRSTAYIAGPALGGALVSLAGASTAFIVATVVCSAAVVLLSRLALPGRPAPTQREPALRSLDEGLRFALRHELLRPMILTSMIFNIGWFLVQAVFVVHAIDRVGMTPATVGIALGISGAGGLLSAFAVRRLSDRLPLGGLMMVGPICGFLAAVILMSTLWIPSSPIVFVSFFLFGFGPVLWAISTTALRQAVTPLPLLGRVSSLMIVSTYGARPLGAGLAALVSAVVGLDWCLVAAAVVFAAQLVVALVSRLPRVQRLPDEAPQPARAAGASPAR